MVRVRVCGTVDSNVADSLTDEVIRRQTEAVASGDSVPSKSMVLQEAIAAGLQSMRRK
jgi:hypothetical protein